MSEQTLHHFGVKYVDLDDGPREPRDRVQASQLVRRLALRRGPRREEAGYEVDGREVERAPDAVPVVCEHFLVHLAERAVDDADDVREDGSRHEAERLEGRADVTGVRVLAAQRDEVCEHTLRFALRAFGRE